MSKNYEGLRGLARRTIKQAKELQSQNLENINAQNDLKALALETAPMLAHKLLDVLDILEKKIDGEAHFKDQT